MTRSNPLLGGSLHPSDIRKAYQEAQAQQGQHQSALTKSRLIEKLRNELPVTFSRSFICHRLGGIIARKTLSNLDSLNKGPASKMTIGRRVSYEREDFLEWLEKRI